jgi:hypothetical protein
VHKEGAGDINMGGAAKFLMIGYMYAITHTVRYLE